MIGKVRLPGRLVLAPMSGVTCSGFRRLILMLNPGAVGLVVSEFISIEGLTRQNAQSLRMLHYREEERPVSIQIFGGESSRMADAARMVQDTGADIVDINCGCPVPKVVKRGGGCELMRQPEHLQKILEAVRSAVQIPLTLKIRAGWDTQSRNAVEIARMAEQTGVEMIAVHGRTRQEMYRGSADWTIVKEVADAVRIPVIGSGDVVDQQSLQSALSSRASGVMIGRGALHNPWIFTELMNGCDQKSDTYTSAQGGTEVRVVRRSAEEVVALLHKYVEILREDLPDKAVLGRMKQLSSQVTRLIHRSARLRKALCCSSNMDEYIERLNDAGTILSSYPSDEEGYGDGEGGESLTSERDTRTRAGSAAGSRVSDHEEPYGEGCC